MTIRTMTKKGLISAAVGAALVASLSGLAPAAQAASLTGTQIDAIVNLLHAFGADSTTIVNVQAVLEGTATSTATASTTWAGAWTSDDHRGPSAEGIAHAAEHASVCSAIARKLSVGSSGEDVTRLQRFLAQDREVYPSGLVTGYFGRLTEEAIQRWQAAHGVVATGTPATTGFGVFGPMTRAAFNDDLRFHCVAGDATASSTASGEGDE